MLKIFIFNFYMNMQISFINPYSYGQSYIHSCINGYYPIGKGQYLGEYRDEIVNSNETYFFRNDINWIAFMDYISERFQNIPKVETIIYGCSDGSEPYSLSMILQSMACESEKFFPIKAFDIDDSLIIQNVNKKSSFKVENTDCSQALYLYESQCLDYSPYLFKDDCGYYYLTNKTTQPVQFKQGNIIVDVDKFDFKNPVLFLARNMWPYVAPGEYPSFARKLYDKLPSGSSLIIGSFDYKGNRYLGTNDFPNCLLEAGFKKARYNIARDIPVKNLAFEKD